MTHLDRTKHIPKFGGEIWYINKGTGADTNSGKRPDVAFETIGAGITAMSKGDALNIKAGTYTETGLDLSDDYTEIWCEIGVLLDPATGTCLTVSGDSCRVGGDLKITPAVGTAIGLIVSGAECHIEGVKVLLGTDNIRVTGSGCILRRCASGFPSSGNACYDIQGIQGRYIDCNCVGNTTSYGYQISGGVDTGVLENCTSVGNQTSGFHIATGSKDWTLLNCSSGHGDGRWVDTDHSNVWSDFHYDNIRHKTTTFASTPTTYNMFKVTGSVTVKNLYGMVETIIPNTSSDIHLSLYSSGGEVDVTNNVGAPDIDTALVGSLLSKNGLSTDAMALASSATPVLVEFGARTPDVGFTVVADADQATYIRLNLTAALASGAIDWHCHWEPYSDNGFLEDA